MSHRRTKDDILKRLLADTCQEMKNKADPRMQEKIEMAKHEIGELGIGDSAL